MPQREKDPAAGAGLKYSKARRIAATADPRCKFTLLTPISDDSDTCSDGTLDVRAACPGARWVRNTHGSHGLKRFRLPLPRLC